MAVLTTSLQIYQGEDKVFSFTLSPVVDITGFTLSFDVKDATTQIITRVPAITSGPAGTFTVTLIDTNTDAIRTGIYTYDVWRTNTGFETVLAIGTFTVDRVARDVV